jgi:dihydropyrimidinase
MFPRKGVIAVGSDADLVVLDPEARRAIRAADLHSACDYDPYEGWDVTGWPEVVVARGEIVFERGNLRAEPGRGKLIRRASG